jgi:hypothetical protein
MAKVLQVQRVGDKVYCHLIADDEKELKTYARRLHVEIHGAGNGKGRAPHLDLTEHQRNLALRYGAQKTEDE